MPTDKPITLQEHAMRFGTFMGIFWIFKFIIIHKLIKLILITNSCY